MNKRVITITGLLILVSACTGGRNEISAQIEAQFNASPTASVNLALVGPAAWERVCVLGPYTNNERTEGILGFKWDSEAHTSIGSNDGINVLVFTQGNKVIAYAEHPRNKGDFSKLEPRCLVKNQATVFRQPDSDGWVYLVTRQQGITSHSSEPSKAALLPPAEFERSAP